MKRPAFQFYPGDWKRNTKLRRCSEAARGAWIELLCLFHDAEEYGVLRWPLKEILQAAGISRKSANELIEKGVLKGADKGADDYVFQPTHAGKKGDPVTLVAAGTGPCWYCSRFVRDEYVRQRRGANTRFGADEGDDPGAPKPPPKSPPKGGIGGGSGDGASASSASASRPRTSLRPVDPPDASARLPETFDEAWSLFEAHHREKGGWSGARALLAAGQANALRKQGDAAAIDVLVWATARNLADLTDAARRMAADAAQETTDATRRRPGESLTAAAERINREHDERERGQLRIGHG